MSQAGQLAYSFATSAPAEMLLTAIWFFTATIVLDFFDISLPRGDATGVTGPLCAATLVILGPTEALAIGVSSAVVAHVLRRGGRAPRRLFSVLGVRIFALAASAALLWRLTALGPPWNSFGIAALVPAAFLASELAASQVVGSNTGPVAEVRTFLRG